MKNDLPHVLWEGRPRFGVATSLQLTPQALVIRRPKWRGNLWIPLDRIVQIRVVQNRLGRWMGTGTLRLSFRGSLSITLKRIPQPYELWKRLKVARHHLTEPLSLL